ncbi:hypothetical protein F9874_08505 [Glaesserella parasuis]|uniref:Uncharacterized protein n=1 Tax=Glaesserella parasuis TaxID=738 RepID=A0A859IIW6_GLAPU|nr:hypothetical protein [Glaesserella parasuis]MWQ00059.1 hypothetical protein [Glaesserella parasuis]MWQ22917.1 hypothetical protein [Glaesserella parasuis]MWQ40890.1 hypothetical protein [Glaesserella parasuis]MWQ45618.1 hypothetical protein [Glaesserella parasuis]
MHYKNNVEYYFVYHVSLFSDFGKMGSFLFIFQKRGLKALCYKALSHFLATILSITLIIQISCLGTAF